MIFGPLSKKNNKTQATDESETTRRYKNDNLGEHTINVLNGTIGTHCKQDTVDKG